MSVLGGSGHRLVGEQGHDRTDDRSDDSGGLDVELPIDEEIAQEPTYEGSDQSQDDRADGTHRFTARDDRASYRPCDQSNHQPNYQSHVCSLR